MRKISFNFSFDPIWWRILSLISILFFVYLADAIMSDWAPTFTQKVLGNSFLMGLVMAFSSLVGLVVDLVFPQLLKGTTVKKLILMSLLTSLGFALSMFLSTWWPLIILILVGMAVWGVYYELLGFANQQFVSEEVAPQKRSMVWATLGIFKSFAYFLGPILSGYLALSGDRTILLVVVTITVVAAGTFMLARLKNKKVEVEVEEINLVKEVRHWWTLFKHVWPIILISLVLGLVDATYWTTGTVWTDKLAKIHPWGGMFLSLYMLPIFLMGFVMAYLRIYKHKKKIAEICVLIGGILLACIGLNSTVIWQLGVVFVSSCAIAAASPLVDATYTDVVTRMGQERKHLIGLSNSTISLAYIIGPVIAGALANVLGERMTFSVTGVIVAVISAVLILVTPRKLKLPQVEIQQWNETH